MKRANKYKVSVGDSDSPEKGDVNENSDELKTKIQELHKKARQEMRDDETETLNGLSPTQELRLKETTNKALENGETNGTDIPATIDSNRATEDEKKRMSYAIIKKWKKFARSGNKKTEHTAKEIDAISQKSVRFKSSTEDIDSQIDKNGHENGSNIYSSRVVFPAITKVHHSSKLKEKKQSQEYYFLPRLIPEGSIQAESSNRNRVSASERFQDRLPPILLTPVCLTSLTSSNSDTDCESPTSPVQLPQDALKVRRKKEKSKGNPKESIYVEKSGKLYKETLRTEMKKRNELSHINTESDAEYIQDKLNRRKVPFSAPNSPSGSPRLPTPFPNSLSQDSLHEVGLSFGRDSTQIWRVKNELFYTKNVPDVLSTQKRCSSKTDESKTFKARLDSFTEYTED